MCLKSGLLCETIWALDAITILLHDDSSVMFFTLKKMPGLLDALLAHYKSVTSLVFFNLSNCCIAVYRLGLSRESGMIWSKESPGFWR